MALPGSPPRTTVEAAVLDTCPALDAGRVMELVLRAVQRRLTTPDRLRAELAARARHPWRRLLAEALQESEDGVTTMLELRYVRDVERAHGLPRSQRNRPEKASQRPGSMYRDVRYQAWHLLVELDGRIAHPPDQQFRDMDRDNHSTLADDAVLRYGWVDVTGRPCGVAEQVVLMLRKSGWSREPRQCAPGCGLTPGTGRPAVTP